MISPVTGGMNVDIRTLAFTAPELHLLRYLLQASAEGEIHAIHTSMLDPKSKTRLLVQHLQDHCTLLALLSWQSEDHVRAYRQVNSVAVGRIRQILVGTDYNTLQPQAQNAFKTLVPNILKGLERAMSTGQDKPLLPVSMDKPVAKA